MNTPTTYNPAADAEYAAKQAERPTRRITVYIVKADMESEIVHFAYTDPQRAAVAAGDAIDHGAVEVRFEKVDIRTDGIRRGYSARQRRAWVSAIKEDYRNHGELSTLRALFSTFAHRHDCKRS